MIDLTPNPKQLQYWIDKISYPHSEGVGPSSLDEELACLAYRAGADYELEKCCAWLAKYRKPILAADLKYVRRPNPPTLAEQATANLDDAVMRGDCITTTDAMPSLRSALARLAELEALHND